ncbi:hypothetical protein DVH24_005188 [Malus domestica]|uniref:Uncharacterized protein n=1 Tax=Malus domestica TaxID=3750 RepID=A0A498IGL6_MALDO|nr:hypothetical protein DVH24_005188 [Malus domestica]
MRNRMGMDTAESRGGQTGRGTAGRGMLSRFEAGRSGVGPCHLRGKPSSYTYKNQVLDRPVSNYNERSKLNDNLSSNLNLIQSPGFQNQSHSHLSTIRHSLDSDDILENPVHHHCCNQHNGTTHPTIILEDIPENPGPRTTTARFSPFRQHHRRRGHCYQPSSLQNLVLLDG